MEETFEGIQETTEVHTGRTCVKADCNNVLDDFDKQENCRHNSQNLHFQVITVLFDAVFHLPCGEPLKVGRAQRSTIPLLNDNSVSRDHASIFIIHDDKNLNCAEKLPEIILQDNSSTYGTFVNEGISSNKRIPSNEPQNLKNGDLIRFGVLNNVYCLTYQPLVVTSSQLISQDQLKLDLLCLGGHLVKEWTSKCSLLTMQELKLTAKTVSALATGSHIVTPAYFTDMVTAVKSRHSLPNPSLYLPQLKEPSINGSLVSFSPDPIRRSLFSRKTFLFQKRVSFRKMGTVISHSGGQSIELLETNFLNVTTKDHILVKSLEKGQDMPSFVIEAYRLLEQNGLTAIPESDIGLAILYKNVEKYCNPNFKVSAILQTSVNKQPQITQPLHIYATETQYESESTSISKKDILPSFTSLTTIVETGVCTRNDDQMTSKTFRIPAASKNIVTSCPEKSFERSDGPASDTFVSTNTQLSNKPIEEKENLGKRKRERSSSLDKSAPPISKRRSFLLAKSNLGMNGVLQDSVELLENEKLISKTMELDTDVFEPIHFSTEKASFQEKKDLPLHEKVPANPNSNAIAKTSKSNIRNTSLQLNSSVESESYLMSDEDRVAKSIPFEPYTLPSLEFHENINQNMQVGSTALMVIKTEPQCQSASQSERVVDSPDHANLLVKGELQGNTQKVLKRQRSSSPSLEKACNDNSNLFAIPFPSARQKRRAKENAVNEIANTNLELTGHQESNEKDLATSQLPESTHSRKTIKNESNELDECCPKKTFANTQNINPFISKETHPQNPPPGKADDVSHLGKILEKSLMVVEVVSLIRPLTQSNATLNTASTGLTNFKRFRKVSNMNQNSIIVSRKENSVMPKIIGGCDLIAHTAANSRREEFLASQPSENVSVNHRNEQENSTDSGLDPTFLQPFPNMSSRRRRR